MKQNKAVDGLRGLVAFTIAYGFHYVSLFWAAPYQFAFERIFFTVSGGLFSYASDLFFLLSGYFMFLHYEDRLVADRVPFGKFLLGKIKKLYPLMILTALLVFLLENLGLSLFGAYPLHGDNGGQRYSLFALILNCLGLQTGFISDNDIYAVNGPSWFVSIFLLCNCIYFLITRFVKKKALRNFIYGALMVLGIFCMFCDFDLPLLYTCNGRGYFTFFFGVLFGEISLHFNEKAARILSWPLLLALMVFIYFAAYRMQDSALRAKLTDFILWPLAAYCTLYNPFVSKVFSLKPFAWLGKYAMAVFLCNMPVLTLFEFLKYCFGWNYNYESGLFWLLLAVCGIAISYLLQKLTDLVMKKIRSSQTRFS